jgi:5-methyltetrahydrofolate--homocysteine methyltransferase
VVPLANDPLAEATEKALARLTAERVLLLDGAMGSLLRQHAGPTLARLADAAPKGATIAPGNYELLNLLKPELVAIRHDAYLAAGADLITTNTFNANRLVQADFGTAEQAYAINRAGAALARQALAGQGAPRRFVVGSIGPTRRNPARQGGDSPPGLDTVPPARLRAAAAEAAEGLITGGADLLLVETVTASAHAHLALEGIAEAFSRLKVSRPVMVAATVASTGSLASGETIEAFARALEPAGLFAIGLNCALSAADMTAHLRRLAGCAATRVLAYPNAGYPAPGGHYPESPDVTAAIIGGWLDESLVNIVGGCCGTTPAHIAALAPLIASARPRRY